MHSLRPVPRTTTSYSSSIFIAFNFLRRRREGMSFERLWKVKGWKLRNFFILERVCGGRMGKGIRFLFVELKWFFVMRILLSIYGRMRWEMEGSFIF